MPPRCLRQMALLAAVSVSIATLPAAGEPAGADLARVRAYEQARVNLIERIRPAVACLFGKGNRAGGGSGVIIDAEGYGLTNFHVVAMMLQDRLGECGLDDGKMYDIEVLGIDPTGDVAMFRATGREDFPHARLGDSDALRIGDYTLAIGNPFLLAEDYVPTVTLGIVSGLHRYQQGAGKGGRALRYTDCIQVDTSINPGNSGGPLFDLSGDVVGINGRVSIEERGRVNVGVGYAISINQIKRFIPMLRAGLTTRHASAGFTVRDRGDAVIVDEILEDSPAYKAGLRLGDSLLRFAGREVASANQFLSHLGVFPAHWPVIVEIEREAGPQKFRFRLEDLPLPESEGPPGTNPYGPHAVSERANRRAVERALALHHASLGGAAAVKQVTALEATLRRSLASRPQEQTNIDVQESREEAASLQNRVTPIDLERAIRWTLMGQHDASFIKALRVVDADEIDGRIAVVLRHRAEGRPEFTIAFDDENGRLLRIAFTDPATGRAARYEYADHRRFDALRLPGVRRLYIDDEIYAADEFEDILLKG